MIIKVALKPQFWEKNEAYFHKTRENSARMASIGAKVLSERLLGVLMDNYLTSRICCTHEINSVFDGENFV